MERPKPLQADRRFPLWISFLLGMAGVLVTIAGVYELTRQSAATPPPTPTTPSSVEESAAPWQRQAAEQREAERQAAIAKIRRQREQAAQAADGWQARCMDGTLILRRGNEIRSAGHCDQRQ